MTNSNDPEKRGGQRIEADHFDMPGASRASDASNDHLGYVTPSAIAVREGAPWWYSQFNLMLCVFGLLVVAAGLFVLLSPAPDAKTLSTVVGADGSTRTAASVTRQQDDATAPWDEKRRAQARTDSQDVLASLLRTKKALEQQNVKQWAPDRYQQALDTAAQGDDYYKQKEFAKAVESYQSALTEMQSLNDLIPEIIAARIADAEAAIVQGKSALAREKFEAALKMDSSNIAALKGLDRVKTLDEVLDLMRSAVQDEQDFLQTDNAEFLTLASDKFEQAIALDKDLESLKTGLSRIQERLADKQYRDAMSQGFNALFAGRYGSARAGFSAALKVRPDDTTAKAAYRQSLASDKRSSLSSLLASAKQLEAKEEWASALSNYQVVLQRDPNQVAAKLGKIRSEARSKLDQELKSVLADPLALARSSQRTRADSVLQEAKAIKRKGPLLNRQIAQLEASLQDIGTTVKVSLVSDSLTEISLTKAGANKLRLGKFDRKKLALSPGRYVLTGVRLGYRDVRQEIELRAVGDKVQTFSVVCDEPVASNASLTSS